MSCSIDLLSQQATISPWWSFDAVGCRGVTPSALHGSADFTGGPFNCVDPWSGQASGGASYQTGFNGPNRARMKGVCAVAVSVPMDASSEYYLFSFIITNAMTVGAGSCAGCTDGVCLVLQSVLLTQPVGPGLFDYTITNPLLRQHVTWQPGGTQVTGGCPGGTPVRTRTWGGVKALYR
jgi:hypothetical protein